MTAFVISVLLTIAPWLYPQVEEWLYATPDTPASDLVMLRYPYAVAKDHSLGPNARTELVKCDDFRRPFFCGISSDWVVVGGVERPTIFFDTHQTATVGMWLVVRDRQGKCYTFDTTNREKSSAMTDLAGVNAYLTSVGAPPVSDADFRTFEELADERSRRRVKWSLVGLAIGILPLAGVVLVAMVRRRIRSRAESRSNARPGCGVHS